MSERQFMNKNNICIVCFKGPEKWDNGTEIQLIKHHVSYFPELIAYVHFDCHQKIHDPDNPLEQFIQYTREDSIRYYELKKKDDQVENHD